MDGWVPWLIHCFLPIRRGIGIRPATEFIHFGGYPWTSTEMIIPTTTKITTKIINKIIIKHHKNDHHNLIIVLFTNKCLFFGHGQKSLKWTELCHQLSILPLVHISIFCPLSTFSTFLYNLSLVHISIFYPLHFTN